MTIEKPISLLAHRGWSVDEFERLAAAGFFLPDEKLELIAGEILHKMTQNEPYSVAIRLTEIALNRIFGAGLDVRVQMPIIAADNSRPEPDIAVVTGAPRDYLREHPRTALLIVEVSDATLEQDRNIKTSLYAAAQIGEYWIVNLRENLLEIYRTPAASSDAVFGWEYRSVQKSDVTQTVSPLSAPQVSIAISDILP